MNIQSLRWTAGLGLIAAAGISHGEAGNWSDNVKVSGDLRLRHEYIDQDGRDERHRERVRARAKVTGTINEDIKGVIGVASGESDPVSTNQTLDDGFSSKGLQLDLAYVDWDLGGVTLTGGKMKNPMVLGQDLVWDGDLNPEGVNLSFSNELGEGINLDGNLGYYFVEERSSDDETNLLGATLLASIKSGDVGVKIGGGYFMYDNVEGFDVLFDGDSFGNSVVETTDPDTGDVTSSVYATDYSIAEGYVEVSLNAGLPIKLFADYVVNTEADDNDTGVQVGISLNKAKNPGDWELAYNWRDLEADAVFGAFTDSDFAGGGTDGEGHKVQAKYQVAKNWQASATVFVNTIAPDTKDTDYTRVQLDLIGKF